MSAITRAPRWVPADPDDDGWCVVLSADASTVRTVDERGRVQSWREDLFLATWRKKVSDSLFKATDPDGDEVEVYEYQRGHLAVAVNDDHAVAYITREDAADLRDVLTAWLGDGGMTRHCPDCAERVCCPDHGYRRAAPLDGRCDVCDRDLVREGDVE